MKNKIWAYMFLFIAQCSVFVSNAYALGGGGPDAAGGEAPNMLVTMFPFILMFLVLYLLIIRPQQKKQKDHETMIQELKKGDKVVTSGGMHGTITGVKEKDGILTVQVAKDVQVEVSRGSISRVAESKPSKASKK